MESATLAAPGARSAKPAVIGPAEDALARLPHGPRILIIGAAQPAAFGDLRLGVRLGRELAGRGGVVVTGGCQGLTYAAVRGAASSGGAAVAVAPWSTMSQLREAGDPLRGFSHVWLTKVPADLKRLGIEEGRFNHWSHRQTHDVVVADAVVVTPGHGGTLGELGNALALKRPIAVLQPPGEAGAKFVRAMRAYTDFYRIEKRQPLIRFFKDPAKLAAWVIEQSRLVER